MNDGIDVAHADRRPARERVYQYVRSAILSGRMPSGSFVEEAQVSNATGVSRTPVREAFQQLAAERMIELLPRRGALVRLVTPTELIEVYEARRVVECHAARHICRTGMKVPVAMEGFLAEMHAIPEDDLLRHIELDHAFHRVLVAATSNSVLTEMYDGLRSRQQRVAITAVRSKPDRLKFILAEHRALLDALNAVDATEAVAVLDRHLRPIDEILLRLSEGG